ncbi:hypothetical protein MKY59_28330 [Paenibacillus sp. FSL W8-0426]|uniref:hypothetical protein n=1 Tax=Paenibacillus sp. FSL W8-0426 TaxID=2921714 RepID=UPI0030DAEDEA
MIPYNVPAIVGTEIKYVEEAIKLNKFSGDGAFTSKCSLWFRNKFDASNALLTTSCTHALEMAAILADIQLGEASGLCNTIKH